MDAQLARRAGALMRTLLRWFPPLLMSAAFSTVVIPVHVLVDYDADDPVLGEGRPLTREERRAWAALVKQLR